MDVLPGGEGLQSYAALWLRDELHGYAQQLRRGQGLDFQTRIGLNSGEVVVGKIGDDLRMDYTAQGQTVHLAKRMEQLAEADKPYLAPPTVALVEGFFTLDDLGNFNVKGVTEPLRLHALAGVGQAHTRLEVARTERRAHPPAVRGPDHLHGPEATRNPYPPTTGCRCWSRPRRGRPIWQ